MRWTTVRETSSRPKAIANRPLHTSHAFHSAMMEPIAEPFAALVEGIARKPASLPCVSTVSGDWIEPGAWAEPEYWARNLRQPVRFADAVATVLEDSQRVLLEVGPGQTLTALTRQQGALAKGRVVASMRHPAEQGHDLEQLLRAVASLWIAGVALDWPALHAGQRRQRVPLPSYPFERERCWIEPTLEDAAAQRREEAKRVDVGRWFWTPEWRRAPLPVADDADRCFAVFVDELGLGAKVAAALRATGARVVEVRAGEATAQLGDDTFALDPRDRDGHRAVLEALRGGDAIRPTVLHLWSVAAEGDPLAHSDRGFQSALATAAAANQVFGGEIDLTVVTNGLQDAGGTAVFGPERATVHGVCAAVPMEVPLMRCRSVDVDPHAGAVVDQLVDEARSEAADAVVAYRGRFRWVQVWDEVPLPPPAAGAAWRRQGGVYLIAGGLGGIGTTLARALVDSVGAKVVLVGRSGLPPRDQWAGILSAGDGDRMARRIAAVQALEEAGGEVMIETGDIADRQQMQAVVERAVARFGAVHGLIHAAGAVSPHMMEETDDGATAGMLAPKVAGLPVLAEALAGQPLDFIALCSSVSAMLGGIGMAHYSASNHFLDAWASSRAGDGPPVISINWDLWADVGMAVDISEGMSEQERREAQRFLEQSITSVEGSDAFLRVLGDAFPRVAVATYDLPGRIDRARRVPEAAEPEIQQSGLETHERPALASEFVEPQTPLEKDIAGVVRELVGVDQVGIRDNLFDLGFDSLLAHRMIARLKDLAGIGVPLRVVLESPSVEEIGKYVEAMRWAAAASKGK